MSEPSAPIVAVQPHAGFVTVEGVLRELHQCLNPLKTYRLDDTALGRAMLGPLGKQPHGKVTVHSPGVDGPIESFTAWIPSEWLADKRLKTGLTVLAVLEALDIPGRDSAWVCVDFELVG